MTNFDSKAPHKLLLPQHPPPESSANAMTCNECDSGEPPSPPRRKPPTCGEFKSNDLESRQNWNDEPASEVLVVGLFCKQFINVMQLVLRAIAQLAEIEVISPSLFKPPLAASRPGFGRHC